MNVVIEDLEGMLEQAHMRIGGMKYIIATLLEYIEQNCPDTYGVLDGVKGQYEEVKNEKRETVGSK